MKLFSIPTLLMLLCLVISSCKKNEPDPPEDQIASPPSAMLRLFDFPAGSWWHYRCLNDSTMDTLTVTASALSEVMTDDEGMGEFVNKVCSYNLANTNGEVTLNAFKKQSYPAEPVIEGMEDEFKLFRLLTTSTGSLFSIQNPFIYPIEEINGLAGDSMLVYQKLDTTLQGTAYTSVYRFPEAWVTSVFAINPMVEEWYVRDIGVVRYTFENGLEYELAAYFINQ